jgi:hypothetical protein
MAGNFTLHHGLSAADCTLRISRIGTRDMDLSALPPKIRRVVNKEEVSPGWQEVARVKFNDGMVGGRRVVTVEGDFVRVSWVHALAASSAVLPLSDNWEYRFELLHKDAALPLATWTVEIDLRIQKPADIDKAKLVVRATGRAAPLEVGFTKE